MRLFWRVALVRTTVATRKDAERLAGVAVDEAWAACVHIEEIRSLYWWKGTRHDEVEFQVEARVRLRRAFGLARRWKAIHPYKLPLIERRFAWVGRDYARWMCRGR